MFNRTRAAPMSSGVELRNADPLLGVTATHSRPQGPDQTNDKLQILKGLPSSFKAPPTAWLVSKLGELLLC